MSQESERCEQDRDPVAAAYRDSLRRAAFELAVQARLLQRLWDESDVQDLEFVHGEVACLAHLAPMTAGTRLSEALLIAGSPHLLSGLEDGRLLAPQAAALVRELGTIEEPLRERVLDRVLGATAVERAERLDEHGLDSRTPGELAGAVKRALVQLDADAAAARRKKAVRDQTGVRLRPGLDGVAALVVTGEATLIAKAWASVRARAAVTPYEDHLTQGQRELAALLHALDCSATTRTRAVIECPVERAAAQAPGVVDVRMSMATALALADEPAQLTGYGPIDADAARALLPASDLVRALVDATTGEVLAADSPVRREAWQQRARVFGADATTASASRASRRRRMPTRPLEPEELAAALQDQLVVMATRGGTVQDQAEPGYVPSASLGRLVDLRDVTSVFPGDSTPARRTDRDHRIPHPHGPTAAGNLQNLSRHWHRAKHASWRCRLLADGDTVWTSPRGNRYARRPRRNPPPVLTRALDRAWRPDLHLAA